MNAEGVGGSGIHRSFGAQRASLGGGKIRGQQNVVAVGIGLIERVVVAGVGGAEG